MAGGSTTLLLNASLLKESSSDAPVSLMRDWVSTAAEAPLQLTKTTRTGALEAVLLLSFILVLQHKEGRL